MSRSSRAPSARESGIELSVSGTTASRPSQESQRFGSLESAMLAVRTLAQDADDLPVSGRAATPQWHSSMRFLVVSTTVVLNNALRAWCIYFFAIHRKWLAVIWQLFFELVGFRLSLHITWHDPDVQRRLTTGSCCLRLCMGILALLVLGLLQVIHVKRAWARQLRNAAVLESLEDQDYMWSSPVLGAQRGLPVAVVTNIPALPIIVYAFLLKRCFLMSFWNTEPTEEHSMIWWCEPKTLLETYILGFSITSQLLVLSLSVIDVDIATSAFLARRYSGSLRRMLYPFFHVCFRTSEVISRLALLGGFLAICAFHCGLLGVLTTALICLLDLMVLLMILQRHSPKEEAICVHLVAAAAMLVTDSARFVDRPGFCHPARLISKGVQLWRRLHFVLLVAIALVLELTISRVGLDLDHFIRVAPLGIALAVSLVLTELSQLPLKVTGDDLHTAMLNHKLPRVRKLLEFSSGGEVLDVNGPTKDAVQNTAAMLGAQSGFLEGLRMLMATGGKVEVRNALNETCIHFAVRHLQLEVLEFLVSQAGGKQILRTCRRELLELANAACGLHGEQSRLTSDERQLFLLLEPERDRRNTAPTAMLQNVRTHLTMGRHLRRLFPNANEEQGPELHDLHSVSALLATQGMGALSRLLLSSRVAMGLEGLRRIRTLGQGASGTVIEVECDAPASRSSLRLRALVEEPKRFAMKLQSKRNVHMDWQACSEVVALRRCGHPFIVRLEQAFQTPHYYALLLELCPNGDVNQLLCTPNAEGRYPGLPTERAAKFGAQVLLALVHLHEAYGIIYRDVKPKNVLLSAHNEAKLADFGLALYVGKKFFSAQNMPLAGTPSFWAPELVLGEDDGPGEAAFDPFKTDAYSFGVTLLLMLLGEACAEVQAEDDGMWMIPRSWPDEQRAAALQHQKDLGVVPPEAVDLLETLLSMRQRKRSRLADVLQHDFFLKTLNCKDLSELLPRAESERQ